MKTILPRRAAIALSLALPAAVMIYGLLGRESAAAPEPRTPSEKILARARLEVTRGVRYDAEYRVIGYPGGDVPSDRGACTDVVIRALRTAGRDLQALIHADKVRNPERYPRYSGRRSADTNIDHRRVPNHLAFLRRFGKRLSTSLSAADLPTWQAGDLVYVKLPSGLDHCGVISDRKNAEGVPFVIHNLSVAAEEDVLGRWKIVAHYRYPAKNP